MISWSEGPALRRRPISLRTLVAGPRSADDLRLTSVGLTVVLNGLARLRRCGRCRGRPGYIVTGATPNSHGCAISSTTQRAPPSKGGSHPISRGTNLLRLRAITANGTIDVAAANACHVAGSRRASLASIDGMPAKAVMRKAPKNTIAAVSPSPRMCTAAQTANDHSIGWRVTRVMPRGGWPVPPDGPTIVGFRPLTEATNRTNAGSMASTSNQRSQPGATHSSAVDAVLQA